MDELFVCGWATDVKAVVETTELFRFVAFDCITEITPVFCIG